jgi:hypothetical protein
LLRAAFPAPQSQPAAQLVITGKMGGLSFTKNITAVRDALADAPQTGEWAFRAAENLAHTTWNDNWTWDKWDALQDSIKAIGYAYHIITTNTAFLALEPGMTLTVDSSMASAQASANATVSDRAMGVAAPSVFADSLQSSQSLDDVSLEALIAGNMQAHPAKSAAKAVTEFGISAVRSRVAVTLPTAVFGKDMTMALIDMKGRTVMTRNVSAQETRSGTVVWNLSSQRPAMSSGIYLLRVSAGQMSKVFRLPALR